MKNKKMQNKETKKINFKKNWSKKQIVVLTLIFLLVGAGIFIYKDYQAKGATYGWFQTGWGGGTSANVRTHSAEVASPGTWTNYSSANNVTASSTQVTMGSGATSVTDTNTTQFNLGTDTNNTTLPVTHSSDEVKLNLGYSGGSCGSFTVMPLDMGGATPTTANWTNAMAYCDGLCATCDLPSSTELGCMYTNRASFGNNFVASNYWSATGNGSAAAYFVNFYWGDPNSDLKTNTYYVRCVRR